MKWKVITTEMYSSTYIVDANSEEEAIQSARLSGGDPIETVYNETLRDRDSMHVVKLPDWEKGEQVADVVEKHGKYREEKTGDRYGLNED